MRDLKGMVAWVTGAGSGIGEATAISLADAGMRTVLSGRREVELERVAARINEGAGSADVARLDVSRAEEVDAVADGIRKDAGRIDVLVHSAGLNRQDRRWEGASIEGWDEVIRVNLDGAYYCCRAALPIMRERGGGLIVNISSWAGRRASAVAGTAYSASKHGVNAMTETINMEEGVNGIRACAVCPGEVSTPILDKRPVPVTAEDRAKMLQPEDIAEIVLFLARLPERVCVNDLLVSPAWNRAYVSTARR